MSNNIIRFDDNTKLKPDKDFGINGSIVDVSLLKSRSASVNQSVPLVFQFDTGFDIELSLYLLLKNSGMIKGAGSYFYIDGFDQCKFSQIMFRKTLFGNEELYNAFMKKSIEVLKQYIDYIDEAKTSMMSTQGHDIASMIMNQINNIN